MIGRPNDQTAPADAGAWSVSATCRHLMAGQPFRLHGGSEMVVRHRIAGRRGLQSDLLVLDASQPHFDGGAMAGPITVAELEAAIDAGAVGCMVDARAVDRPQWRDAAPQRAATATFARRIPQTAVGDHHPPIAAPEPATPSQPPPRSAPTRPRSYADEVIHRIMAVYLSSPHATVAQIHACVSAEWPPATGRPPSRGTIRRWIRGGHLPARTSGRSTPRLVSRSNAENVRPRRGWGEWQ